MNHPPHRSCPTLACFLVLLVLPSFSQAEEPTAAQLEFFEKRIRPALVKHCYECHSAQAKTPQGGLLLDSRSGLLDGGDSGPAVVPGQADESLLLEALRYQSFEMPPQGKLPDAVIADFEKWIQMGLPDPRGNVPAQTPSGVDYQASRNFWAFQQPIKHGPPRVKNRDWPQGDIDRFVLAKLEAAGLKPVAFADRRQLIRRTYFNLIGLPPAPEAVESFVRDASPNAFMKVVDELLDSPHYGERWGRIWLDVARYAEDQAHTFKARKYPQGYLYRDWVVRAFNNDLPYDQFLTRQIAGDLIDQPHPERRMAALGLFALGPVYYQDNSEKDKALADEWDDRVDTLMRGTQALTVSCARCHDHKYDPISMTDYYGLLGIFASTDYQERPVVPKEVVETKTLAEAAVNKQQAVIDQFLASEAPKARGQLVSDISRYLLASWQVINRMKDGGNERKIFSSIAREEKLSEELLKRWTAYLQEKPKSGAIKSPRPYLNAWRELIRQQDLKRDLSKDKPAIRAVNEVAEQFQRHVESLLPQRELLAKQFGENIAFESNNDQKTNTAGYVEARLLSELFADQGLLAIPPKEAERYLSKSATGHLGELKQELESRQKSADAIPILKAHALTEGTSRDLKIHLAGDPKKPGDVAPRGFPALYTQGEHRSFDAAGSGRLQLARAIASPDNPLTARVMVNRIWAGHFGQGLVRTPSNFGQLGERPTHPELLDTLAVRLMESGWSLKSLHREILLSATYQLSSRHDEANEQADPENRLLWQMNRRRLDVEQWRDATLVVAGDLDRSLGGPSLDLAKPDNRRRTIYGFISRHELNGLLRLFDFPDPNVTSDKRPVTTVPLQQLFVLNSEFMISRSRELASRLRKAATTDEDRIRRAYLALYGREPSAEELALGQEFLKAVQTEPGDSLSAWEQYSLALLGSNEFTFLD